MPEQGGRAQTRMKTLTRKSLKESGDSSRQSTETERKEGNVGKRETSSVGESRGWQDRHSYCDCQGGEEGL